MVDNKVTVDDIAVVVEGRLTKTAHDIGEALQQFGESELVIAPYYIVKNKFWDKFLQKLFAQLISIKVWALAIITTLIVLGYITGAEFIIGFSIVMGAKGGKDIVMKWAESRKLSKPEDQVIDKV